MRNQKDPPPPPVCVWECRNWITPEDLVRHALDAFDWASGNLHPPIGEPFLDQDGLEYADRATFADCVAHFFDLRVKCQAYELGIGDYSSEADMLFRCEGWPVMPTA